MEMKFIEKPISIKDVPKEYLIDPCLLENNEKQIDEISKFLQGNKKLLFVNGYRGCGKTKIVNFIADSINPESIVLNYTCLETTNLDDMLLGFFEFFKYYALMKKFTNPKTKVENFIQKINSYFNVITVPTLIILDSFESIMKDNIAPIIAFIKHLTTFPNIKVIIVSKTAPTEEFSDIEYNQISILAFSQKIFEKYIRNHGIKQIGVISNELYKLTKGYYQNIVLSLNIMNLRQLNLVNFLELYSKSYTSFSEFIIREAMELVDPISIHLFRLLTVMRIPIHVNLLQSLHLFDDARINFYVQNSILSTNGDHIYLKDYFREILERQIPENVRIKLHSACIELYKTQLPLKPLERDLKLSRQTMRNEIEYHSLFIPKKPIIIKPKEIPVEPTLAKQGELKMVSPESAHKPPTPAELIDETKEEKIDKINFVVEDETLYNIADSIKEFIETKIENQKFEQESQGMNLSQLMNAAKAEEDKYNYKNVVKLYHQALTKTKDENFYTFLPTIYIKLAKAYQHLSDWYEALECYTQAEDFYVNTSNKEKISEIKLEIANIYYIMYKHDNAKFILQELKKTPNLPNELQIKINLSCAKLANNPEKEYHYYQKSLPLVEITTDKAVVAELYYKYAVANDEKDNPRGAVQFYKKCIDIEQDPKLNPYLSLAMSNLAELYDEAGYTTQAVKYYSKSIQLDKEIKNYNGLFYSYSHLGEIYIARKEDTKAFKCLSSALDAAVQLKEIFYIADAKIKMGDFYYKRRTYDLAYKYYSEAYKVAEKSFTKENLNKITSRIEDIKQRVSEKELKKYQEEYDK